jgi:hypothetical protein
MKTIIAAFSFLLVSTVILSNSNLGYGAASDGKISAQQFAGNCANAVLHRDGANGLAYVQTLHISGNQKYPVKEYRLKTNHPDTQNVAVWVGKGNDKNLEVPRITDICLDGSTDPDMTSDPGDIIFYSKAGHTVAMSFHLNGMTSTWKIPKGKKVKMSDSVWMVSCTGSCTEDIHPTRDSWPQCMTKSKDDSVKVVGYDVTFDMCSNSGSTDNYSYEVHMDQAGKDGISVDVGIDPQIINHPT